LEFLKLDLSDFVSIEDCIKNLHTRKINIDIVIDNAAVLDTTNSKTKQGYEMMFGVNYLGHYFLNRYLINNLMKNKGRLVIVSSDAHEVIKELPSFDPEKFSKVSCEGIVAQFYQYGISKLCNNLNKNEIHKRYHKYGITVNSLHPGAIDTNIGNESFLKRLLKPVMYYFTKTTLEGSQTTLHVACSPELNDVSGKYFSNVQLKEESKLSKDEKISQILWEWSEKQCSEKSEFFKQAFQK
jgi:NAD(P)-dependent dehydrogenase (short-subunit alcohol dehydrogenase family)